jgi:osmotically-inducible protein OsmY
LKTRFLCLILISVILLAAVGCGKRTCENSEDVSSIKQLDQSKVTAVKAKFAQDKILAGQVLKITVINQECTLEGVVPTEEARDKAVQLAASVEGISTIIDKLEVKVEE